MNRTVNLKKLQWPILLLCVVLMTACSGIQPMRDGYSDNDLPNACNFKEHLKCIALTGKETIEDGFEGKFTRHWGRMSYIGKACEKRYGRTTAVILESLFAIPHYTLIAFGNSVTGLLSPFVDTKKEKLQKKNEAERIKLQSMPKGDVLDRAKLN